LPSEALPDGKNLPPGNVLPDLIMNHESLNPLSELDHDSWSVRQGAAGRQTVAGQRNVAGRQEPAGQAEPPAGRSPARGHIYKTLTPDLLARLRDADVYDCLLPEMDDLATQARYQEADVLAWIAWGREVAGDKAGGAIVKGMRGGKRPPPVFYDPPCRGCGRHGKHDPECRLRYLEGF
jgi:hypothetical protein